VTWFESMPAGSLKGLVLHSSDLEGDYSRLLAKGVSFQSSPQKRPWGFEAVFTDPDGNAFVLQQA
jgi:hypothetical protein